MTDNWLIIGGGIHGTHLSLHLTQRGGVRPEHIRVLDPYPLPLAQWLKSTRAVGMRYLRSPIVHNLHWDQGSLGLFARIHQTDPMTRFIPPFGRPSLELFNAHAQHLIQKFGLETLRIQGRATAIRRIPAGWRVETADGALDARRLVIAISLSEQPYWPEWSMQFKGATDVQHIFSPDFDRESLPLDRRTLVVGGGITAAQAALALAAVRPGTVTLARRHDERVFDFDSDVGWMNDINLRGFAQIVDVGERRHIIREARHRGSVPSDVARAVATAVQAGALRLVESSFGSLVRKKGELRLATASGQVLHADQIILATGYAQSRPGGAMIDSLVQNEGLPVASCDYPIISKALEWAPGLHMSGPLAELEIGPASRNIIGARMAGQRLVNAI